MDRSFRRLGQLLVVMGALLGAVLGVALALIVENAETSRAVAALGRLRAAVRAASSPSSEPPASRAARSQDPADGSDSPGNQRAQSAGRADHRAGKTDKKGEWRYKVVVADKAIAIGTVGFDKKEDVLKVVESLKATMAKGKVVELKSDAKDEKK